MGKPYYLFKFARFILGLVYYWLLLLLKIEFYLSFLVSTYVPLIVLFYKILVYVG